MADLAALRAELDAGHPVTGVYDADDAIAADQINALNRTVNLSSLTGDEIFAATDSTEFSGLTDAKRDQWISFCARESYDPFGAANVAFVNYIFGGGSDTITNLQSLRTKTASRAEELGLGRVRAGTVAQARAL